MKNQVKTTKKENNWQFSIVLFMLLLLFAALGVTSCSQTQHLCPAYGNSWDRTQPSRY